MPRPILRKSLSYDDINASFDSSTDRASSEEADDSSAAIHRSLAAWSTSVNDSCFKDEESDTSLLSHVVDWSREQSTAEKILYILGSLAAIIIFAAGIFVFREWGLATDENLSTSANANVTEAFEVTLNPTRPPESDPSGETPLLWMTNEPTSPPLPPSLFATPEPSALATVETNTALPTIAVTTSPTAQPVSSPTSAPVTSPTSTPSSSPTGTPSTSAPSPLPTATESQHPSNSPTSNPTVQHSASPTSNPTPHPTPGPTSLPTQHPSPQPSLYPTTQPTSEPSFVPTSGPTAGPTAYPTEPQPPTFVPGNLIVEKLGLLLSEGLDARLIAVTDEKLDYDLGGRSKDKFHDQPDAGATFPDERPENPGGWIYVSNAEVENGKGGVGGLTFDKDGNLIDYQMLLEGTNMNCGGGRTPWNTWVSCEEVEHTGLVYQVDPTGQREPAVMTLGSNGGRWESFAYDIRDRDRPHYYITEDHNKGTVRRFTPDSPNWDEPWDMLHGAGTTDYLMIFPNRANDGGTFIWSSDREGARNNARAFYPQTEGIDVYGSQLFYVCKNIRQMFVLNLDEGTYYNHTTLNGLFDGKPDQMQRVLDDPRDMLYFTEEGGVDAGVHARDHLGRFYTVFESPVYPDETTGLSFSPDGRFLYTAYQNTGRLYQIWREDGFPFHAAHLDVKYHQEG